MSRRRPSGACGSGRLREGVRQRLEMTWSAIARPGYRGLAFPLDWRRSLYDFHVSQRHSVSSFT